MPQSDPIALARKVKSNLVKTLQAAADRARDRLDSIEREIELLQSDDRRSLVAPVTEAAAAVVASSKKKPAKTKKVCKVCHKAGHDARRHNVPPSLRGKTQRKK